MLLVMEQRHLLLIADSIILRILAIISKMLEFAVIILSHNHARYANFKNIGICASKTLDSWILFTKRHARIFHELHPLSRKKLKQCPVSFSM